jgi:hypothetical protein
MYGSTKAGSSMSSPKLAIGDEGGRISPLLCCDGLEPVRQAVDHWIGSLCCCTGEPLDQLMLVSLRIDPGHRREVAVASRFSSSTGSSRRAGLGQPHEPAGSRPGSRSNTGLMAGVKQPQLHQLVRHRRPEPPGDRRLQTPAGPEIVFQRPLAKGFADDRPGVLHPNRSLICHGSDPLHVELGNRTFASIQSASSGSRRLAKAVKTFLRLALVNCVTGRPPVAKLTWTRVFPLCARCRDVAR